MGEDRDFKRIDNATAMLGEHFDSVQIVATRTENGKTITRASGRGNWHACYGSVRVWLMREDAVERSAARRDAQGDDE